MRPHIEFSTMKRMLVILGAPFALLLLLVAGYYFGTRVQAPLSKPPDHGLCFTLEADAQGIGEVPALKQAILKRFSRFGTRIFWEPISEARFKVYTPAIHEDAFETASELVWHRGVLQFRLAHLADQQLLSSSDRYETMQLTNRLASGSYHVQRFFVSNTPEGGPSGLRIRNAMPLKGPASGQYEIAFTLAPDSAETFRKVTQQNIGRQLAVIMDGELLSAPVIRGEIAGG